MERVALLKWNKQTSEIKIPGSLAELHKLIENLTAIPTGRQVRQRMATASLAGGLGPAHSSVGRECATLQRIVATGGKLVLSSEDVASLKVTPDPAQGLVLHNTPLVSQVGAVLLLMGSTQTVSQPAIGPNQLPVHALESALRTLNARSPSAKGWRVLPVAPLRECRTLMCRADRAASRAADRPRLPQEETLTILRKVTANIVANPTEPKFRKLNKQVPFAPSAPSGRALVSTASSAGGR
jgi:hypothetical protein